MDDCGTKKEIDSAAVEWVLEISPVAEAIAVIAYREVCMQELYQKQQALKFGYEARGRYELDAYLNLAESMSKEAGDHIVQRRNDVYRLNELLRSE